MRNHLLLHTVSLVESVARWKGAQICRKIHSLACLHLVRNMGSVCGKNVVPMNPNSSIMSSTDYIEEVVCQDSDIKENEMKVFDLQDAGKVLLVRQKGKLNALGTKCTHYGAPLVTGALGDGRIRCPWHGACFNITTGDIEDFPGLDSIPCYQVTVEDNNVRIRAKRSDLTNNKRIKTMHKKDCREGQNMVIIGGGPSGACCVETLRQEGYTGDITLINKENCLPYDRVKVSKSLDLDIKKTELRSQDFYKEHGIDVFINTEAVNVDTTNKKIELNTGKTLEYDRLYLATGSKPRKLNIPGSDLVNVCILREYVHGQYIHQQLSPDKHVVILGVSFIGMEAAAYCADKVERVTVIGRDNVPFKPVLGEAIGHRVMQLFEEKGVKFIMNSGIKQCIGEDGKLTSVELNDGSTIKADVCLMGIGSTLYTEFLANSGIEINNDGSITVDEHMETNIKGVFAGGDIAKAPVFVSDNEKATIGHYPLAHYHGKIAAMNMLGKPTPLKSVPFFWTMLFGKSIRYAGHGSFDDLKVIGDLSELKFIAYYFKDDRVIAMSSCQQDPIVSKFAELLAQGKKLYRKDLEGDSLEWAETINSK